MEKFANKCKLNNMLLKNHCLQEENKRENKNYLQIIENENTPKLMGYSKGCTKREVYSDNFLH